MFEYSFRNGVSLKTISGENSAVTSEMTALWMEKTFPTIFHKYKMNDIFNADEFRLFYQCFLSKTYHLLGEKCSGGKTVRLVSLE